MNDQRTRGSSRVWLCAVAALGLVSSVATTGCGDGPICQAEVLVIIRSPNGIVLTDSNVDMSGVQTDVRISSTVGEGKAIVLTVLGDGDEALGTVTGMTDADGDVVLEDVDLPAGAIALRAAVDAGECGSDEDEISLQVVAGDGCELALLPTPLDNDFYAPLGVLNRSNDGDPDAADFQAEVEVTAQVGFDVELFVLDASGAESSLGAETADGDGVASFAITLGQGRQSLRAVCAGAGGILATPSISTSVFVDTASPDCAIAYPAAGSSITPGMDLDDDLANGVQLQLTATAEGGDTEGEATQFVVTVDDTPTTLAGSDVDVLDQSSVDVDIDPSSTPSTVAIAFSTQDHAGNSCAIVDMYPVVYDGCDIAVVSPTAVVTADADGDTSNGIQLDIGLQVDTACAGRTVASDCGLDNPIGVVAADGTVTLRAGWCAGATCDVTDSCTFSVTNLAGIDTSAGAILRFDNLAPVVTIQVAAPVVACGAQISPAQDQSPDAGVQVRVRVVSPLALGRTLDQTTGAGTQNLDASGPDGEVLVTLASGLNTFVGHASDANGNAGTSGACALTLVEIAMGFSDPAADGAVGAADGVVTGSDLTFDLCGTVSEAGTTVSVTVDGGPALAATVTGVTWCVSITVAESPPAHAIVATATSGVRTGQASLSLSVDLAAPGPITDLAVIADTRQSLTGTWTAPADGAGSAASYLVKVSTVALTDGNFDTTGEVIAAPAPQAPGASEILQVAPRRTGTAYWYGVAAVDAGGNRAPAAIVGPVTPLFDQTAAILPRDTGGNAGLGFTMTRGRFNSDSYDDVAVGAPYVNIGGVSGAGAVYVYFGSATGIGTVPDAVIAGLETDGSFGSALATVRWSSATRDDLVVGAPFNDNISGQVFVFNGAGLVPRRVTSPPTPRAW